MKPENVNPDNFTKKHIVYDNNDFSIAYGTWEDGEKVVAMRWYNYPNNRIGQPIWFKVTEELAETILISLLNSNNITNDKHQNILESIKDIKQTSP